MKCCVLNASSKIVYEGDTYEYLRTQTNFVFPYVFFRTVEIDSSTTKTEYLYVQCPEHVDVDSTTKASYYSDARSTFDISWDASKISVAQYGIATISESAAIGGNITSTDTRCITKSDVTSQSASTGTNYNVKFRNGKAITYSDTQAVKHNDLMRDVSEYAIVYHKSIVPAEDTLQYTYGGKVEGNDYPAESNMFTFSPNSFRYWTNPNSSTPTAAIYPNDSVHVSGGDVHLYANWAYRYYVRFETNGHGNQPGTQVVFKGSKATQPSNPTASGYRFLGWYLDNGVWQRPWNFDIDKVEENITLYAYWGVGEYMVKVIPNPSSSYGYTIGSGMYNRGDRVSIGAYPYAGHEFSYWFDDSSAPIFRTIEVSGDITYNALFTRNPTWDIRLVASNRKLYTYSLYNSLNTQPTIVGVGLDIGDDWLVCYIDRVASSKIGSDKQVPSSVQTSTIAQLMYPHSGKPSSDQYVAAYPVSSSHPEYAEYGANRCAAITDGGLDWYLPNMWELNTIFSRASDRADNDNSRGIQSHLETVGGTASTLLWDTEGSGSGSLRQVHAYWSSEASYVASTWGGPSATGRLPWRTFLIRTSDNNSSRPGAWSYKTYNHCTGDYTYCYDPNYIRPMARLPIQATHYIRFNKGSAESGTAPASIKAYHNEVVRVPSNYGNLSKEGWTFVYWTIKGSPSTVIRAGSTVTASKDLELIPWFVRDDLVNPYEPIDPGTVITL